MTTIGIRLDSEDYMAISRAMDANANNRIDKNEASVSWSAHNKIGNSNGVVGKIDRRFQTTVPSRAHGW